MGDTVFTLVDDDDEEMKKILESCIARENAGKEDAVVRYCVACRGPNPTMVLLPCKHLCYCSSCWEVANNLRCPLCREEVKEVVNFF